MNGIGLTQLLLTTFHASDAVVHRLLESEAEPEAMESICSNALHHACTQANHVFVSHLLDKRGPDFETFYRPPTHGLPAEPSYPPVSKSHARIVHSLLAHIV